MDTQRHPSIHLFFPHAAIYDADWICICDDYQRLIYVFNEKEIPTTNNPVANLGYHNVTDQGRRMKFI